MRQALALLRWAHKFGPEEHVQRAERFLCERMRLMTTVRPSPGQCTCAGSASAPVARQRFDLLQVEGRHRSFEVDILFSSWAVAELWGEQSVYARALELSPGAVHRIARSLCVGLKASRHGLWEAEGTRGTFSGPHDMVVELEKVTQVSNGLTITATAATMAQWRTGEAE